MASIANDPGGRKRILFVDKEGDRRTVWLGRVKDKHARRYKDRLESLVSSVNRSMPLDKADKDWLGAMSDEEYAKLANVGLVTPRMPVKGVTVGEFLERYIAGRTDAKERTMLNLGMFRARLIKTVPTRKSRMKRFTGEDARFDPGRDLTTITPAEADAWVTWLKANYAAATVGRTVKGARQFFKAACRAKIIADNPFEGIKAGSNPDKERQRFISQADTQRVIDECPDAEWRLLVALSRYGGLRCPSEHLGLTWPDIDWARDRFWVRSPKTEHHEGKGGRWVPLFPELRPYLQEAYDLAADGAVHVITRYRDERSNLRTAMVRIIRRAGLTPWPKPFHNLRASRETELAAVHPLHVVCTWIGNDARVAQKHYLQVTEADFQKAVGTAQNTAHFSPETAHFTAQSDSVPTLHDDTERLETAGIVAYSQGNDTSAEYAWRDSNPQPMAP
jgi:integrase